MVKGISTGQRPADGLAVVPPTAAASLLAAHQTLRETGPAILTAEGILYLQAVIAGGPDVPDLLPRWDGGRRQLWLGGRLLKEFRQPAPNQTALLDAFERRGWASHIVDPLPPEAGEREDQATLRLQETVKNLNRGFPPGTIRFRGDGTGRGVRWEVVTV